MVVNVIIALFTIGFILSRQIRKIEVENEWKAQLILLIIGVIELAGVAKVTGVGANLYLNNPVLDGAIIGGWLIAIVMAFVRVPVYTVTIENGKVWRQGGAKSLALWAVTIALHVGYTLLMGHFNIPYLDDVATPSLMVFMALSLGMQKLLVLRRAKKMM
ncbi:hypothetical protein [Pseudolactococcus insecticola]|uniref:DUF1453 domain-containing protein n=1 Tax=Pseudolactococcus insecticola TaxID=2709158 RepID=A0A6A0B8D6_9LACT|nr:hypothetical protein [Lactococcus insecticola]GFH40664.1 hypothetical protein Hs20B_10620 [Lactococcus insecticola]